MRPRLRIALLTHSTNPRGGVSHCLSLAEALTDLGHEAVVHAPDPSRRGFYRAARCGMVAVPAMPVPDDDTDSVGAMVRQRIAEYRSHFEPARHRGFDLYHAHDGIGGNALADLSEAGLVPGFLRTVHHLDAFKDREVAARQIRAVTAATALLCVSDVWVDILARDYGRRAHRVGNGVDTDAFSPLPGPQDAAVRAQWGLGAGPVFLSVGGFENRKNSLGIIEAFGILHRSHLEAQLLVVGGASVLDHAAYAARCEARLRALGLGLGIGAAVIATGPVPQAMMPALYRLATALVFPSLSEGFGLAVIEAMASGTPVIASRIAPFTEYLTDRDAWLVEPTDPAAIAAAMRQALMPTPRETLIEAGFGVARRFDWRTSAEQHLAVYADHVRAKEHACA